MAKTEETLKLEQQIYRTTHKMGVFGCFEVTIGWYGKERVDYMTYDTKGIFRCFEIKVSKADFNSKAKLSFVGHYNYYVLTPDLYEEVKNDIPSHIGVYVGSNYNCCNLVKRAKKQELLVDEQILKDSMIRSLTRYLDDQLKSNDESYIKQIKRELSRMKNKCDSYKQEHLSFVCDTLKIEEVKKTIAQKTLVTYDNTDYTVTACILRLKGREWNYALELKDLKANSVRIVNMDKVKIADLSKDNLQGE